VALEPSKQQLRVPEQAVEAVPHRRNQLLPTHFGQWVLLRQWRFMLGDLPEGS